MEITNKQSIYSRAYEWSRERQQSGHLFYLPQLLNTDLRQNIINIKIETEEWEDN